jgi:hypothetical protein
MHNLSLDSPAIHGELPKIPYVVRTTAGEKGLTLAQTR